MLDFNSPRSRVRLSLAALLVLSVAACQSAPLTGAAGPESVAQPHGGTATATQPKSGETGSQGANVQATAGIPRNNAEALVGATAMKLTAAAGGQYTSADGSLTVTVPPGALSQDATVKFARINTSGIPSFSQGTPGIMFAADLGGAKVADNQQITVTARVDSRLITDAKQHVTNFDPAQFNLSQDASGAWVMAMPLRGDQTNGAQVPQSPGGATWSLAEFGPAVGLSGVSADGSSAPVGLKAVSKYGLLTATPTPSPSATATPTPSPSPTATPTPVPTATPVPTLPTIPAGYSAIDDLPAMPVSDSTSGNYTVLTSMKWWDGRSINIVNNPSEVTGDAGGKLRDVVAETKGSQGEFFTCLSLWHPHCGTNQVDTAIRSVELYNQAIVHNRKPTDAMRADAYRFVSGPSGDITNCSSDDSRPVFVNLRYDSDDTTDYSANNSGQNAEGPIVGANVVYGSGAAVSAPVVTDSNGSASHLYGAVSVTATAAWTPASNPYGLTELQNPSYPNPATTTVVESDVNSFIIHMVWHKYSPTVTVALTADLPIQNPVFTYTVDGRTVTTTPGDLISESGAGTLTDTVSFRVKVNDDSPNHTFAFTGASANGTALLAANQTLPASTSVFQRTKTYPYSIRLHNIAAK